MIIETILKNELKLVMTILKFGGFLTKQSLSIPSLKFIKAIPKITEGNHVTKTNIIANLDCCFLTKEIFVIVN